jgi:hypothetical protein
VTAGVKAGCDSREHAGEPRGLCCNVAGKRGQQAEHDLDRRGIERTPDPDRYPSHGQTDDDPTRSYLCQLPRAMTRGEAAHDRRDRHLEHREAGAIVDQRLTLEDRGDPLGSAEVAHNRAGGHGIGRRRERAEDKRRGPRNPANQVTDRPRGQNREQNQACREADDLQRVSA